MAKEDASSVSKGISSGSTQIPGSVLGRRLQTCTNVAVQNTDFVGSNPFGYLDTSCSTCNK